MAITATLVMAAHNRLRYFITSTGSEGISIESDGGPSPDLLTDSIGGALKRIFQVKTQGYGKIPVGGVTTDAQCRALLLSDNANSLIGAAVPTAIVRIEQVTGSVRAWTVTASRGPTDTATPGLSVVNNNAGASSCYITIEIPSAPGT